MSLSDNLRRLARERIPTSAGMRSRASGAARLDASFCCFCERALALSELRLFPRPVFPFALSLDVRRRSASLPVATASANQIGSLYARAAAPIKTTLSN